MVINHFQAVKNKQCSLWLPLFRGHSSSVWGLGLVAGLVAENYGGACEQGTEPLTVRGAILRGSPLALTSLHILMHVCISDLCV